MPTPGPYRVLILGSEGCAILAKPPGHQHEIRLAVVNGKSLPEDLENARLFAAAPEMLDALRRLEQAARSRDITMGDPCRLLEVKAELDAAAAFARTAIAKATKG